jgi:hypothetical protein
VGIDFQYAARRGVWAPKGVTETAGRQRRLRKRVLGDLASARRCHAAPNPGQFLRLQRLVVVRNNLLLPEVRRPAETPR